MLTGSNSYLIIFSCVRMDNELHINYSSAIGQLYNGSIEYPFVSLIAQIHRRQPHLNKVELRLIATKPENH